MTTTALLPCVPGDTSRIRAIVAHYAAANPDLRTRDLDKIRVKITAGYAHLSVPNTTAGQAAVMAEIKAATKRDGAAYVWK